jgi:hypothetical protein
MALFIHEGWTVVLSKDFAYFDLEDFTTRHHINMEAWFKCPVMLAVIDHLWNRGLMPLFIYMGRRYLRIELLESLLVDGFLTEATPEVPENLVQKLIDNKICHAGDQMGKEYVYIKRSDSKVRAMGKVTFAVRMHQHALKNSDKAMKKEMASEPSDELTEATVSTGYEVEIRAVELRMLLAMLMIHGN